ncbi:MAG: hypothetical protein NTW28_05065 [Candidatus Solibacter sp.]|nr:hypothetical protein [Candidatus Solibacter sp.]
MKATALLTALAGILLVGCALRGKPAKSVAPPAAPKPAANPTPVPAPQAPPPLSIPQTRVELPKPQPVDPAAFDTEATPPEPPPAAAPVRSRRANPAPIQPAGPPAAATAPPEPRETVQEIVPPAELKRLRDSAQARRREVNQILEQRGRRQLTDAQRNVEATIRNFLTLSEDAEKHNDLRQADALAERAQILAKELQSGK